MRNFLLPLKDKFLLPLKDKAKAFLKRMLSTALGTFTLMFVAEFISFFIIVANTRAYTHGNYTWTVVTDTLFSLQSFCMSKLMIDDPKARTWWAGLGFTLGGTLGSCAAIFVTETFLHF